MTSNPSSTTDLPANGQKHGAYLQHKHAAQSRADCMEHNTTFWMMGLPIDCINLAQTKARIREAARERKPLTFATVNTNFLALAINHPEFRNSILRTDMSLADGMPLVWIGRILRIPIPERVAGSTIIDSFLADNTGQKLKVFVFGGQPGVAEAAAVAISKATGDLQSVGWCDPGFGSVESMSTNDIISEINGSGADLLIVALGAEKGHAWIDRNRAALTVPVISHLGAVVNFLAGTIKRAPTILQRMGMEWLWRIAQEPRLASRYAKDGAYLLREMVFHILPSAFLSRAGDTRSDRLQIGQSDPAGHTLDLQGALTHQTLPSLHAALSDIQPQPRSTYLNLKGLTRIDESALGYLYRRMHRSNCSDGLGARVSVTSLPPSILVRHRAAALLVNEHRQPSESSIGRVQPTSDIS